MIPKKPFLRTASGKSALISIVIGSLGLLTTLLINYWTLSSDQYSNACLEMRAISNELIELVITITHKAQSEIGVNQGACYAADGQKTLKFQGDQSWIDNYVNLRVQEDLLIAKAAILGGENLEEPLFEYRKSLSELLAHCVITNKSYDTLWKQLRKKSCELNQAIGSSVSECFGIQSINLNCSDLAYACQ